MFQARSRNDKFWVKTSRGAADTASFVRFSQPTRRKSSNLGTSGQKHSWKPATPQQQKRAATLSSFNSETFRLRGVRCGVVEGQLSKDGEGEAALPGMRGSGPSGVSSTGRCCADAPQPEVFNLVGSGGEVQPFSQKVRASRLARSNQAPSSARRKNASATKQSAESHGRRLRSPESKPTSSTSRNS